MLTVRVISSALCAALVAGFAFSATPAGAATLEELANGDHRSAENKARNAARHPVETLEFFGLEPDMTVVELTPATGWYTEIIAPYVNEDGQYYGANYDRQSDVEFMQRLNKVFKDKLDARPDLYGNAKITDLTTDDRKIAPDGSADLVVGFRNLHDWVLMGSADTIFKKAYAALKPGGIFGIVEARQDPSKPQEMKKHIGYTREDYAIQIIEAAGFELVDKSEINANPKDTKDWEGGTHGMPKGFEGETDRFTLKFRKPE